MNYLKEEFKSRFKAFLSEYYYNYDDESIFTLDLAKMVEFDSSLAEDFLFNAEELLPTMEEVIDEFYKKELKLVLVGYYPGDRERTIFGRGKIRLNEQDVGKLVVFEGQLTSMLKEKRLRYVTTAWECQECGGVNYVKQDLNESKLEKPLTCGYCGKSAKFKLIPQKSTIEEVLTFKIQENDNENFTALRCQMVGSERINYFNLLMGEIYKVIGILKFHSDGRKNDGFYYLDVLGLQAQKGSNINLTEKDIEKIKEYALNPDIINILKSYIAPDIRGMDAVKESLLLQLVGGVDSYTRDGVLVSGNIHILLIGDPGTAKTQLMKSIALIAPKAVEAIGTSSSKVGLTVSAVKDAYTGEWEYIAGVFPRANGGIAIVDEVDTYLKREGDSAFLQALESQQITKAVAGAYITMSAKIAFLGGANPRLGKFEDDYNLAEQVDITPRLFSRLDLIWIIKDIVDENKDRVIAKTLLKLKNEKEQYDYEFFKKYISYARELKPQLSEEAEELIIDYYVRARKRDNYITPRQVRSIKKLAMAYAKLKLKEKVEKEEAEQAIALFDKYLSSFGTNAGAEINTGWSAKEMEVRKVIYFYLANVGNAIYEEIITEAQERLGYSETYIAEILDKMVQEGGLKKRGNEYFLRE